MHLSPTAKSGLLAAALVGGAFLLLALVFAAFVAADRASGQPGTRPDPGSARGSAAGEGLADRPVSEGSERDDESYILGHRWWRKKPTRADLDRIVRLAIETPSTEDVYVSALLETATRPTWNETPAWFGGVPGVRVSRGPNKRPARADILLSLRVALDAAEFRDGPGR